MSRRPPAGRGAVAIGKGADRYPFLLAGWLLVAALRLLVEVQDSRGDPLQLTQLFGISDPTANRYCAELDAATLPRPSAGQS